MEIKGIEIEEGQLVEITDNQNRKYIGFIYEPAFFKQIMGYKIGLTILNRNTENSLLQKIRHEMFPFKEKTIKNIKILGV